MSVDLISDRRDSAGQRSRENKHKKEQRDGSVICCENPVKSESFMSGLVINDRWEEEATGKYSMTPM